MDKAFDLFIEKQAEIMAVVENFGLMSSSSKKKTLAYIDDFYEVINDEKRRNLRIVEKCKP